MKQGHESEEKPCARSKMRSGNQGASETGVLGNWKPGRDGEGGRVGGAVDWSGDGGGGALRTYFAEASADKSWKAGDSTKVSQQPLSYHGFWFPNDASGFRSSRITRSGFRIGRFEFRIIAGFGIMVGFRFSRSGYRFSRSGYRLFRRPTTVGTAAATAGAAIHKYQQCCDYTTVRHFDYDYQHHYKMTKLQTTATAAASASAACAYCPCCFRELFCVFYSYARNCANTRLTEAAPYFSEYRA